MKILIADDDPVTLKLLESSITKWGYDVIKASNGNEAWEVLNRAGAPLLLILDWSMPGITGVALCDKIRKELGPDYHPYVILLTQTSGTENIVTGLESGANEFLVKPFNPTELKSRINVGEKMLAYEATLAKQNAELKKYISQIEAAHAIVLKASTKLNHTIQTNDQKASPDKVIHFENLEDVNSDLSDIIDVFKDFNPEKPTPKKS